MKEQPSNLKRAAPSLCITGVCALNLTSACYALATGEDNGLNPFFYTAIITSSTYMVGNGYRAYKKLTHSEQVHPDFPTLAWQEKEDARRSVVDSMERGESKSS